MNNTKQTLILKDLILALALFALAMIATRTRAQSVYTTPYAFTNFAGMPGGAGNADGIHSAARFGVAGFGGPEGVAVDSAGNVYVTDTANETIGKITPDGNVKTLTDSTGTVPHFGEPVGIAVDSVGNVYVGNLVNLKIYKVTPDGTVTTLPGSNQGLFAPAGLSFDSRGNLYVADDFNTIRKITPDGAVTTLAGSTGEFGSDDGTGSAARFFRPSGVAVDSAGNVYVADSGNHTIRKITPDGVVTTLAGSAGQSGSSDGIRSAARFYFADFLAGVAVDSAGNVYVADSGNDTIRRVTRDGAVTTLAGSAGQQGSDDGTGNAARFIFPTGVAVDNASNIYVADRYNYTIRKITPAGAVTTLAGSAFHNGTQDGTGSGARFFSPEGVAVDSDGNVYVRIQLTSRFGRSHPSEW